MSNPLHHKESKAERPPIPLPDPDEVRHTFDVAMAKVRERKGFYTGLAVIALLIAVGVIFVLNIGPGDTSNEFAGLWRRAEAVRRKLLKDESARLELGELEKYLETVRGNPVEGETLWLLGVYHYREAWTPDKVAAEDKSHHLKKSAAFLDQLEKPHFDELLLVKPFWYSNSSSSPLAALIKQVREDIAWVDANADVEPTPGTALVAVLRTSEGDVHLQFFGEQSPEHVKNFVSLARKGTYNETLFHFARKGAAAEPRAVLAGDPFTFFYNDPLNKKQILRWGKGGVGYEVPPEPGRYLITHRPGIVTSSMSPEADWANGSQFMIMTGIDSDLDKRHTPFAKVVEGFGVVEKIARRKAAGEHPTYRDDPAFHSVDTRDLIVEPAILHKVIVYENGSALPHDYPLAESEKSLAALSQAPVQPLTGDAAYCGRRMRTPDGEGALRLGLDIPFPDDIDAKDPKVANPLGDRIMATGRSGAASAGTGDEKDPGAEKDSSGSGDGAGK